LPESKGCKLLAIAAYIILASKYSGDKHSSLFCRSIDEENIVYINVTCGLCYKTFTALIYYLAK
jgi:hypothetical protein